MRKIDAGHSWVDWPLAASILAFIAALVTAAGCGDSVELRSAWRDREVVIDGQNTEWAGALTDFPKNQVSVGVMKAVSGSRPYWSGTVMAVTIPTTRRVMVSSTGAPLKPGVTSLERCAPGITMDRVKTHVITHVADVFGFTTRDLRLATRDS